MPGRRGTDASTPAAAALTNRQLRVRPVVRESAPRVVEVQPAFHWSEIESSDYRVYIENLRALGCPEGTIRDLIVADVDQLFRERLRQVMSPLSTRFWALTADLEHVEEEGNHFEKQWEALKEEREAIFKELLGDGKPYRAEQEKARKAGEQAHWSRVLDFLPGEKQEQVLAARTQFEEARQQLWQSNDRLTKEEREERSRQQRELEADRDRQLAALLTPEELAEYSLRVSDGAQVRHQFRRVDFSEDELRTLARLANEGRATETAIAGNSPETKQQRERFRKQTEEAIQEALGEARYADYQRARDNRFEQISQVVERYGLAEESALAVYDMQRQAEAQAGLIRRQSARSAEEQAALLQAIREETERSVRATLGERAFGTYQKRSGDWITKLAAPPK